MMLFTLQHIYALSLLFLFFMMTSQPVFCDATTNNVVRDGSQTRSCCWPSQFTARVGRLAGLPVGGAPGIMEEEMMLEYDYTGARWGFWMRENYYFHEYTEMIYTEEFGEIRKASTANFQGCVTSHIIRAKQMHIPCIPDWAELIDTGYIGSGEDIAWFDTWKWQFNTTQQGEKTTVTVVGSYFHESCRPMSEVAWWTAQEFDYTTYISFLDFEVGAAAAGRSPFEQLEMYYECEDIREKTEPVDATPDAFFDAIYLRHRIQTANYIIILPEIKPLESF